MTREAALAGFERVRASPKPRILFVTHEYGGGVRRHVDELAAALAPDAEVLRLAPAGARVELRSMADPHTVAWIPRTSWEALVEVLRALAIDRVHFHHVHGHPPEVLDLPSRLGCTHDVTLHDHYPICPQYHLLDGERRFCGGAPDCHRCLDLGVAQWPLSIDEWRARFRPVLENAQRVIAPSADIASRIGEHVPSSSPVVWPHPQAASTAPARTLRVLVPGAISPAKGLSVLVACARDAAERQLPLHFHVVGYVSYPIAHWPEVPLTIGGEYREGELPALLAASGGDAIFFPAQVPETFSFTLSDALDTGLPIVATNLGAFRERLEGRPGARILAWDATPGEFNDALLALHASSPPAAGARVSFDDYRTRYLDGISRGGAPSAQARLQLDPSWSEAPANEEATAGLGGLAWLFDDAFLCGRALSRDKLRARLHRIDPVITPPPERPPLARRILDRIFGPRRRG